MHLAITKDLNAGRTNQHEIQSANTGYQKQNVEDEEVDQRNVSS
jgi:hypothetical protein